MAEHLTDTCDFLDLLEEASISKSKVTAVRVDGTTITDDVRDVVTEDGKDYVVFLNHDRVPVSELKTVRKAGPTVH